MLLQGKERLRGPYPPGHVGIMAAAMGNEGLLAIQRGFRLARIG